MPGLRARVRNEGLNSNRFTSESEVLRFEEEVRQSIARDLHDDLGQKCALLTMKVSALESDISKLSPPFASRFTELRDLSQSLADGIQQVSHQLHPATLEHLGLVGALRALVEEFGKRESLSTVFFAARLPGNIRPDVSLCLYRIAQEALRNVSKHAGETPVRVTLRWRRQRLTLIVRDFGPGFDVGTAKSEAGLGLISMQQRAQLAGGAFHVASRKGVGTLIAVSIPHSVAAERSQPRLQLTYNAAACNEGARRSFTAKAQGAGA